MHEPRCGRLEDALSRMDRYSTAVRRADARPRASAVTFMSGNFGHGSYGRSSGCICCGAASSTAAEGFLLAVANAEGTYYRYMKAWWLKDGANAERADLDRRHHVRSRGCAGCGALRSLSRQQDHGFEVLIADDGSGPGHGGADRAAGKPRPRRAAVACPTTASGISRRRNPQPRATLASRGDYVVFLDGDCLARPDFRRHAIGELAEPGRFVTGNRALLTKALTEAALRRDGLRAGRLGGSAKWSAAADWRRAQSLGAAAASAARAAAQDAADAVAGRTLLQSRGVAIRSRCGGWLRRGLQRLGQGGLRPAGAAHSCRGAAQGRHRRDRGAASLASLRPTVRGLP